MPGNKQSLVRRTLIQMDLGFWCLNEHFPPLALLGLPTLVGVTSVSAVIALVVRTYNMPTFWNYVLYAIGYPTLALLTITFAPLPCAVFAWHRAGGRVLTVRECFRELTARSGRLIRLAALLTLCYLFWFVLFGIPMLFLWPRTSLAPLVVLFENERRVLVRCRRLLKEDMAVYVLAALYTGLGVTMGSLVAIPRFLLMAKTLQSSFTRTVSEYIWFFEFLGGTALTAAMAVAWTLSLTLLYREIRRTREGEELRGKIQELRERLIGDAGPAGAWPRPTPQ